MTLHMETGHPVEANVKQVRGDRIRFVDVHGRTAFEVVIKDDHTIEVRGVELQRNDDRSGYYTEALDVQPNYSNMVTISKRFVKQEDL